MAVLRVVPNLHSSDPQALAAFYVDIFGIDIAMDAGFIVTVAGAEQQTQVSLASEGGSGTELPVLSIEVDALEPILERLEKAGHAPVYGPVSEPWGARRFYVKDPAGHLINVLIHE
ncbi:unnamed protein product [Ectocarpus sp. 12 AP-2014]